MDDEVWVPTVFTKNRQRLIEHDAIVAFFNEVINTAEKKRWLSGEHFSVDGTLTQAWAGHKSFVRKDGDDDAGGAGGFKGKKRSNETHESKTDPASDNSRDNTPDPNLEKPTSMRCSEDFSIDPGPPDTTP